MPGENIFVDTKQIDRLTVELKGFEQEVGGAACSAINRTLDHVLTKVGQIIPKAYAIKSTEVKSSFNGGIKRPSKTDLTASLTSKGHTLSLAHFPHTPAAPPAGKSRKVKYVKAQVKRNEPKRYINAYPQPFLATTGAKSADKVQYNIFKRVGKARFPVKILRTLSVPQMITNENVTEQIQQSAQDKLNERLEHEIMYRMTSVQKRISR